jgi:hypothetical protein
MKGTALVPSQHIRSTLGSARTRRAACAAVVLLGATLALSACGAQQAGAAAIVGGTAISEQDVQSASLQLNTLSPGQPVLPSLVLRNLILEPYVLAAAGKSAPGDATVRKAIAKLVNPSPATMDVVRTDLAIQALSPASKASIVNKLSKVKITVSPRYGTFDITQVTVLATSPDWIKAAASTGAK